MGDDERPRIALSFMVAERPIRTRRTALLFVATIAVSTAAVVAAGAGCHGPDPYYRQGQDGGARDGNGDRFENGGVDRAAPDRPDGGGGTGGHAGRADSGADGAGGAVACASCKLVVLYACSGPDANQIRAAFRVINRSAESLRLADVTFRYWYADIGAVAQEFVCDFAMVGKENITHEFVPVIPPRLGADLYVELGFSEAAGTLEPFGDTGEIRVRISRTDQQTITQTDDYSFDCSKVSFDEWNRVTVYEKGLLVGGIEPPLRMDPTAPDAGEE
jgi:endoglucanase